MLSCLACQSEGDGGSGSLRSIAMIALVALAPLHSVLDWYLCGAGLLFQALWQRAVAVRAVAVAAGELLSWPLACRLVRCWLN